MMLSWDFLGGPFEMLRKTLGEIMAEPAGGHESKYAHDLAVLDEMVSASRGLVNMLMPPGANFDLLSDDEKSMVREANAGIDKSLGLRHALERKRAELESIPSENTLVKSAGFCEIAEQYRIAKSRFEDAVGGRLGQLNFAEQQKIRLDYSKAEAAMIEARAGCA